MTAPTMIERIARALCRHDGHPENAKMEGKPLWQDYVPEARAVLESMREPTESMMDAGSCEMPFSSATTDTRSRTEEVWHAMIDAALAEDGK